MPLQLAVSVIDVPTVGVLLLGVTLQLDGGDEGVPPPQFTLSDAGVLEPAALRAVSVYSCSPATFDTAWQMDARAACNSSR